jgi:hypothetical protein
MTVIDDMLYMFGGLPALAGIPVSSKSNFYFVEPAHGNDGWEGKSLDSALATVDEAEDRCVADQNDVVFVIANDMTGSGTSTYLSSTLTWDKDLTHLIGLCTPSLLSQRARIAQLSTVTGVSPLVNVTASGCVFRNLQIFQGVVDATSLINVQVTGARNVFDHVHFAGGGAVEHAINDGCSLKLAAAEENFFNDCTIGLDTIGAAAGFVNLVFDTNARRNEFRKCRFMLEAADTTAGWVEVIDATGIDHVNIFDDCIFINSSSTVTVASAFLIAAVSTGGRLLLKDCLVDKATKMDANDRAVLYGNMDAYTPADLGGVAAALYV